MLVLNRIFFFPNATLKRDNHKFGDESASSGPISRVNKVGGLDVIEKKHGINKVCSH